MKRMFGVMGMILAIAITFGSFVSESEARLSSNNRRAVVLEAFYALRPSHDGSCDKTIAGNCVSNWNYLNNDWNAYNTVKSFSAYYPCFSSDWAYNYEICYTGHSNASFYINIATYGYYGTYGRGGQCKYFANLILYRSGSDQSSLPTYSVMAQNAESDMSKTIPGDILFSTSVPHTAIVVEIKSTGLDVIDANYITDSGSDQEIIARHLLTWSQLSAGGYKIYKGISYYYEPYVP
ncbi:hypothetical protein HZC33_03245 [Candidatus Wolfebacteria bacterium]|nr:hypothetical protein [Candidatus Wolfebacteria bacterium]